MKTYKVVNIDTERRHGTEKAESAFEAAARFGLRVGSDVFAEQSVRDYQGGHFAMISGRLTRTGEWRVFRVTPVAG